MVYINQSLLRIELDTTVDLTSASALRINYRKPSGTTGFWTATADGTKVVYEVTGGDLNEAGKWRLQAFATIAGRDGYSDPVDMNVNNQFIG